MSRQFDGVDDVITATITAMDSGDWTIAAWINPDNAGEGNLGQIVRTVLATSETAVQFFRFNGASRTLEAYQNYGTDAVSLASTTVAATAWSCVVATFRASDAIIRIFTGDFDSAMAEVAYTTQTAGAVTRVTGGVRVRIGAATSVGAEDFDGYIANVVMDAREWTLGEMEAFRLGPRPVNTGTLRGFWPLDSPTASQIEDLSGNGATGTLTGAAVGNHPRIPMGWGDGPMLVELAVAAAAGLSIPVAMHSYRRRRL